MDDDAPHLPSASPVRAACLAWPPALALYLAFADDHGVREVAAGVCAAGLTAAAVGWVARCAGLRIELRLHDVVQVWRMPWYFVSGTGEVLVALWQQLATARGAASQFSTTPFAIGDRADPADAGRRALAVFYTTATPNFVVLGLVDEPGTMLYHQVKPGPVLAMTRRLGARP